MKHKRTPRRVNLSGRSFGFWRVGDQSSREGNAVFWMCKCVCGEEKFVRAANLVRGISGSCGCNNRIPIGDRKVCRKCGIDHPKTNFRKNSKWGEYCNECRQEQKRATSKANPHLQKVRNSRAAAKLRQEVINGLGGACACCGEDRLIFLALDHIHGGGTQESNIIGNDGVYRKARREGFPRDKYQVLCSNCNWAKHVTKGACPHNEPSWMPPTWGGSIGLGL